MFAKDLPERFFLPVAHGEGKFIVRNNKVLNDIVKNDQIVFQYSQEKNNKVAKEYPFNPNGSVLSIAGICNNKGNVLGMMPHPERYWSRYHHPQWTRIRTGRSSKQEALGLDLYTAAVDYASKKLRV